MKSILVSIVVALLVVGCGKPQSPELPTAKVLGLPILAAAYNGNIEAVKQHLAAGTDVNVKGGFADGTPLHYEAANGHTEIAELLLANGADVNAKDIWDKTPLDVAIGRKHPETIDHLRKHGGKTAEELKAAEPVAEAAKPKTYDIPIHQAALDGNIEAVKRHLADGTDMNAKDDRYGGTYLHWTVSGGHKGIVELLMAKGADVNAKDVDNETPLDWAIDLKRTEIADLLRKHGGKTGEELKAAGK